VPVQQRPGFLLLRLELLWWITEAVLEEGCGVLGGGGGEVRVRARCRIRPDP